MYLNKTEVGEHTSEDEESLKRGLTRRDWLQRATWIALATGFPQLARAAANDVSPAMEKLSTYMAEARNRALPDKVLEELGGTGGRVGMSELMGRKNSKLEIRNSKKRKKARSWESLRIEFGAGPGLGRRLWKFEF